MIVDAGDVSGISDGQLLLDIRASADFKNGVFGFGLDLIAVIEEHIVVSDSSARMIRRAFEFRIANFTGTSINRFVVLSDHAWPAGRIPIAGKSQLRSRFVDSGEGGLTECPLVGLHDSKDASTAAQNRAL